MRAISPSRFSIANSIFGSVIASPSSLSSQSFHALPGETQSRSGLWSEFPFDALRRNERQLVALELVIPDVIGAGERRSQIAFHVMNHHFVFFADLVSTEVGNVAFVS